MTHPDYAAARAVDFAQIPVIDLDALAAAPDRIGAEIVGTAQRVGFFYLRNHGIAEALGADAFAAARRFFALPAAAKARVAVDTDQRGWMAQGMTRLEGSATHDAKEVFFWGREIAPDDPDLAAGLPLVALNRWPDADASFLRAAVVPYYLAVVDLGRRVLAAMALGLGKPADFFDAAYAKPLARGQLVHYPAMSADDLAAERFGAAEHTDFGALTLLLQDDVGGLQVRNRAGDWIAAPPIPGTLVCNIGDLLERWTNGRLVSTPHRVINTAGRDRYSIPVFCDPGSTTRIDPADFAGPGEVLRYLVTTAGAHIAGRNRRNFRQYRDEAD